MFDLLIYVQHDYAVSVAIKTNKKNTITEELKQNNNNNNNECNVDDDDDDNADYNEENNTHTHILINTCKQ